MSERKPTPWKTRAAWLFGLRKPGEPRRAAALLAASLGCAALAGCAIPRPDTLVPGNDARDVARAMGRQTAEYPLANGAKRLEFARGPYGKQTYMVDLDSGGHFRSWQQVLTEERFNEIRVGMSKDEVLRSIGRPAEVLPIAWQRVDLWNYRFDGFFCRFFQIDIDRAGTVAGVGYGPDPMCTPNLP